MFPENSKWDLKAAVRGKSGVGEGGDDREGRSRVRPREEIERRVHFQVSSWKLIKLLSEIKLLFHHQILLLLLFNIKYAFQHFIIY